MSRASNRTGFSSNRGAIMPVQITKYKLKSSWQSIKNSTVLQNDNHLFITFPNRVSTFDIELVAFVTSTYNGTDTADFKCAWSSNGITLLSNRNCMANPLFTLTYGYALSTAVTYSINDKYIMTPIREKFIVTTTATQATLQWQWAQNTAADTTTMVESGSYILVQELREFS